MPMYFIVPQLLTYFELTLETENSLWEI